jgi:aminomethyltransferase
MAYSFLPNQTGGVIDDVMVIRRNRDNFMLVVNAACKEKVIRHLAHHLQSSLIHVLDDHALLAVQGPQSEQVLRQLFPSEVCDLEFMEGMLAKHKQIECYVSRSGYTGEDGFEISVPANRAEEIVSSLLKSNIVKWAGMEARNSLRVEAGLCLYGQELAEDVSPVTSGLEWTIHTNRRAGGNKVGGFLGAEQILGELETGVNLCRTGLLINEKVPLSEATALTDIDGRSVGRVSSSVYSPSLEQPIAMAFVESALIQEGKSLFLEINGKKYSPRITGLPFIPHRYKR